MIQLGEVVLIDLLNCNLSESISVLVKKNGLNVPPRDDKIPFVEELDQELEKLTRNKVPIVLAGDFNTNTLKFNNPQQGYLDTVTSNGFDILK